MNKVVGVVPTEMDEVIDIVLYSAGEEFIVEKRYEFLPTGYKNQFGTKCFDKLEDAEIYAAFLLKN